MPGIISEAAAAMQRAAEEAAKERRRAELRRQIQQWEGKKRTVESQIEGLTAEKLRLHSYRKMWEEKKCIYNGNEILSEVVIINLFEGVCADKFKDEFSASITEMDQTYSKVGGLNGNVGAQISRLNQYITVINAKLTSLRNELSSI